MTKARFEVVLESTRDEDPGPDAAWLRYEFRGKPGDPRRRPRQFAPYHLRLDWLMWFLPFSVIVMGERIVVTRRERWFTRLVEHLLEADRPTRALLRHDPFGDEPPRFIRARYVRYAFADASQRAAGFVWTCKDLGSFLPPTGRDEPPP